MKAKIVAMIVVLSAFSLNAQSRHDVTQRTSKWGAFGEFDVPLAIFTGGIATNIGAHYENLKISVGYSHFNAPSKSFSGVPDEFKLRVDYIFALNIDYFLTKTKTCKGLYTRFIYQNKRQYVENKSTHDSRFLYSQLAGLEVGYVWRIYRGLYIAPRIGALYYLKRPQGKANKPILIGNAYYDNKRHKVWDTYFIPTFSIGYSF